MNILHQYEYILHRIFSYKYICRKWVNQWSLCFNVTRACGQFQSRGYGSGPNFICETHWKHISFGWGTLVTASCLDAHASLQIIASVPDTSVKAVVVIMLLFWSWFVTWTRQWTFLIVNLLDSWIMIVRWFNEDVGWFFYSLYDSLWRSMAHLCCCCWWWCCGCRCRCRCRRCFPTITTTALLVQAPFRLRHWAERENRRGTICFQDHSCCMIFHHQSRAERLALT